MNNYETTNIDETIEPIAEETLVDDPTVESVLEGNVVKCSKLNVREKPSSDAKILCELKRGSIVLIEPENSTDIFYKIITITGIEGYCVKEYINVM